MSSQPMTDPVSLPLQTRVNPVESVDAQARKVEVVFTTGAAVRRRRYTGWETSVPFDEILTVSREAVNLERLNAGAPALDSHSIWSTFSQVGVIESARIDGGKGLATIRFPSKGVDERADRMFSLVAEGIIRNVSVGYTLNEVRVETPEKVGEVEKRIATRWTPHEISFVTVPADAGAQVRSADTMDLYPCIVTRSSSHAAALARMRMRQLGI
ncbi:MAG TPA: HK97 family phage prohead protease [Xanthobacteraceae bacterium]|nr:HK97 family phage prohead protease [Xanthobacteraceae bacterium]